MFQSDKCLAEIVAPVILLQLLFLVFLFCYIYPLKYLYHRYLIAQNLQIQM